ncbi:hypothetical protein BLNAU_2020 [Blattamonas nauphoetae]|uniref:Right handed beta helix domain-containing protein n=1 Tax=Blattamonas nauphoetae TaxID=2049346 RepID=A0ABQ9YGW6_9EUKA|nr:hypothetical protein BLNAU_2020 [Blattamonas nauphoetae]
MRSISKVCGCQIQIIRTSHNSKSNLILPLVGTCQNPRGFDIERQMMNDGIADNESRQGVSICGVGLLMKNQHFPLGTGALYTFESDPVLGRALDCVMRVETNLLESSLVNVTSSSPFTSSGQLLGSEVSQRVVGSCVDQSTNHDSGTGMLSPNMGGDLMCLNTSFSSCISERNTDLTFSFENITQTHIGRLNNVKSDVTSVSNTLCTFNRMRVKAELDHGGGAIFLRDTSSSLTITTCFFHDCSCQDTVKSDDGGAIEFRCSLSNTHPFSVSDSSFTQCSTGNDGGCLYIAYTSSISMENCFFERSHASSYGAVLLYSNIITISNSRFFDCSTYWYGGAISFGRMNTLSLSYSQFRRCYCSNNTEGKDVFFYYNMSSHVTSDMFTSCDSTSGAPNVYFYEDKRSNSTLVRQISSNIAIKSVDVMFDGNDATVTVETNEAIKGTMSVLLDGSNVPRLVQVVFGSDSGI